MIHSHYAEIVHTSVMACDVEIFISSWNGLKVSLNLSSKVLPVHSSSLYPVTLTLIYPSTFLCYGVLNFGGHHEALDGIASFEMHLYPIFTANVLKALTKPLV